MLTMSDKPTSMRSAFAQAVENLRLGYPMRHELYLSRLDPVAYSSGTLTLRTPDQRVRDMCALRLNRLLTNEVRYVTGRDDIALVYIVEGAPC